MIFLLKQVKENKFQWFTTFLFALCRFLTIKNEMQTSGFIKKNEILRLMYFYKYITIYKPAHFSAIFSPHILLTSSHLSARKGQQINIFSNDNI